MVAVKRKKALMAFCSFYYLLYLNRASFLSEHWGVSNSSFTISKLVVKKSESLV
jgi:hypothetical protein